MDIFFLDKFSKNFAPQLHQKTTMVDSSYQIYQNKDLLDNLILASSDPVFFFDAVLWTLDHGLYCKFPIAALVPKMSNQDLSFVKACPMLSIYEDLYLEPQNQSLSYNDQLAKIWGQLDRPWQEVSAQFAKIFTQNQQSWLLGLNSWLYKDSHEKYFESLTQHLSLNFTQSPWAIFFDFYYRPVDRFPESFLELHNAPLGPYAKATILNSWLKNMTQSLPIAGQELIPQFSQNLLHYKPHEISTFNHYLEHLFASGQHNTISVYQTFSLMFSTFVKPPVSHEDWLTYQLGKAYVDQNFNGLEKLVENFFTQGLVLNSLQSSMMEFLKENYGLFSSFGALIDHYGSKRA